MKLIKRNYLNELIDVMNTPDIKIITGVRRCGKSKLLDMFYDYLLTLKNVNVIRIKLNLKEYESLKDSDILYTHICNLYKPKKINYVLIDEIQMCKGFETIITSLHEEEKYKIFLTGSNAFLLSSDLATLFGGRVYEISLFPFSFKEYIDYFNSKNIDKSFDEYYKVGGMAGSYLYKDLKEKYKYVLNIYKATIVRDIVAKYKIEDKILLNKIVDYLMDNIGNETSFRNIANSLKSKSYKTNHKIIRRYIQYLCNAFMFYSINKYDVKGKKYYLSDISFRFASIGTKNEDVGHLYENIVCLELLRRGYEVYNGAIYNKEIDFIAVKNGIKTYFQVCYDLGNKQTQNREFQPLLKLRDGYEKIIITRTKTRESNINGIRVIDIARWLLEKPEHQ